MVEVYKHTNTLNGKVYIGYSKNGHKRRLIQHMASMRRGSMSSFHCALRKYGKDVFKSEILVEVDTVVEAKSIETYYISWYSSYRNGYNDTLGGDGQHRPLRFTYEECKEEALKYPSRGKFQKGSQPYYTNAYSQGWVDSICTHMISKSNVHSKEDCKTEALKYTKRNDFRKQSNSHYHKAHYSGWLDEVCSHMRPKIKNLSYEDCKKEQTKYKNRGDFLKGSSPHYKKSSKEGWLEEWFPSTIECDVCGKVTSASNNVRWHGKNCKGSK